MKDTQGTRRGPVSKKPKRLEPGLGTYYEEGPYFCWKLRIGSSRSKNQRRFVVKELTKAERDIRIDEIKQAIKEERDPRPIKSDSLERLLTIWLTTFIKPIRAQKTYTSYKERTDCWLIPELGEIRADLLQPWQVQGLINKMQGQALEPRTIEYTVDVLFRALRKMGKKPMVDKIKHQINLPEQSAQRSRTLRDDEWDKVSAALMKFTKNPRQKADAPMIVFMLFSAPRFNEAAAVLDVDIDQKNRRVSFTKQIEWYKDNPDDKKEPKKWRFRKPKGNKNYSARTIKLVPDAWEAVQMQFAYNAAARAKNGEAYNDKGLLFATALGTPKSQRNVKRTIDAIIKDVGIPHFTIHDLRRTCLTRLAKNKTQPHVLGAVAGHAPGSRVLGQYYVWADQEDIDTAVIELTIGSAGRLERKAAESAS